MLRTDTQITSEGCDITPRYAPQVVMTLKGRLPVEQSIFWPAATAPKGCPIRIDCNVLELRTAAGSRWYGVKAAHINSELRMIVTGFPARFEEMSGWEVCKRV